MTEPISVPTALADVASKRPNHSAIVSMTGAVTFAELRSRATSVGAALAEQAHVDGAPIALMMRQDAPLIATLLGTLAAGRTAVVLDRGQPLERIAYILADAQPSLIVSDDPASDQKRLNGTGAPLVDAGALQCQHSASAFNIDDRPRAGDPALLFYTSGSTGQPKGVLQNHRSLVHGARLTAAALEFESNDRVALLHSCSAAASRSMLFASLLGGVTLLPFDPAAGIERLANWLRDQRITVCHTVPSLFRRLAQTLDGPDALPDLRAVKLGGETLTMADVELFRRRFRAGTLLLNGFGATEFGFGNACHFRITHDTPLDGPLVPVGFAVGGTEVFVVDEAGVEVEAGERGEIVVRSQWLDSTYWRDPNSTRLAFAPLSPADTVPALRTGDVGWRTADGCVTHVGRRDRMIKIRGHRVEPAEVEAAMAAVPGVSVAAVVTRHHGPSAEPQLVGFFVPAPGRSIAAAQVRAAIARTLPRPLVPALLRPIDALPETAGGKVDRTALAALADALRQDPPAPPPTGDVLQLHLRSLWERALGRTSIGITDDFFELGGDSLAAAGICDGIERLTGERLPLLTLTSAPTIRELAVVIRERGSSAEWSPIVALQPHGARPPLYCVPGAGSDVFALQDLARQFAPDQPFYGLQPRGLDGTAPFHRSIEALAAYYVDAIRRHEPHGPYFLAGTSLGGKVAFEMARQLQFAGETIGSLLMLDAPGPGYPRVAQGLRPGERMLLALGWIMSRYRANLVADEVFNGTLTRRGFAAHLGGAIRFWRVRVMVALPHGWVRRPFALRFECLQAVMFAAAARYRPGPIVGAIDLLHTARQPGAALYEDDPDLGWKGFCTNVRARVVPGVHSQHIREPHVRVLAAEIRRCLARGLEAVSQA